MRDTNLLDAYHKANDYLNKKGIRLEYEKGNTLETLPTDMPNIMYAFKKEAWAFVSTPVTTDMLTRAKAEGLYLAEVSYIGMGWGFNNAVIDIADKIRAKLGIVSLSDVTDIEEPSKAEIRKLKTRLSKSQTQAELDARKTELENLISDYEDKESDTEREDLAEHWANIREYLEEAQNSLEHNNKAEALDQLDDALDAV